MTTTLTLKRYVLGLVGTAMLLAGMFLVPTTSTAAPAPCLLIDHYSSEGVEQIVVNANSWKAHERHGDSIVESDVPCEIDEEL